MRKRPNASRAVSLVRQKGLDRTFSIRSLRRRAPRPMVRASSRPCALRFRCVRQSERTTRSWSGIERFVAACRTTRTSPPRFIARASAGSAFVAAAAPPTVSAAAPTTATIQVRTRRSAIAEQDRTCRRSAARRASMTVSSRTGLLPTTLLSGAAPPRRGTASGVDLRVGGVPGGAQQRRVVDVDSASNYQRPAGCERLH